MDIKEMTMKELIYFINHMEADKEFIIYAVGRECEQDA